MLSKSHYWQIMDDQMIHAMLHTTVSSKMGLPYNEQRGWKTK